MSYILSLDQGTTSSRAIVFSSDGGIVAKSQRAFEQHFPNPGWVEHDPYDILRSQIATASDVAEKIDGDIDCVGITNQRETVIVWEKSTGRAVYNAVVWQCRRTADMCSALIGIGANDIVKPKTGLNIDAYFSATKIRWILEHIPDGVNRAARGELLCGTVDCWLIYNLTGGKVHATDVTNASRTMLFNINTLAWDAELCELIGIPMCMLPEVKDCTAFYGNIDASACGISMKLDGVPITGVAGDQQASLFGQTCFDKGDVKNTYGTGCFALMNIGSNPVCDSNGLLTTIGWKDGDEIVYALEGSVFNAGSSIQWLRDSLGLIVTAHECDILAESVADNAGVYFVSAFTGLGAPYWDMYARGALIGVTRGVTKAHICRAVLEGIAFQVCDLIEAMSRSSGHGISVSGLSVDGGASVSDFMMGFQADMLGCVVERPETFETTALGAAYLAGLGAGIWKSKDELKASKHIAKRYLPRFSDDERRKAMQSWHDAVRRVSSTL